MIFFSTRRAAEIIWRFSRRDVPWSATTSAGPSHSTRAGSRTCLSAHCCRTTSASALIILHPCSANTGKVVADGEFGRRELMVLGVGLVLGAAACTPPPQR